MSALSGDASFILSCIVAGLKFTNNPRPDLRANRPFSGLFELSILSHFGPPTAPNKTASLALHISSDSFGSGSPVTSIAAPPPNTFVYSNLWLYF